MQEGPRSRRIISLIPTAPAVMPGEIPALPGHVILKRGPGFGGQRDRPFHFVSDIES